jgi:hypothetical protein
MFPGHEEAIMNPRDGFNAAQRLARFERISWRQALGLVAGAPFRLHRYRDVHSQMLRDLFSQLDCEQQCGSDCDE